MRVSAEWGEHGVRQAAAAGARVIVIVDVLSFSTCVDVAVGRGAEILPFPFGDQQAAARAALAAGARLAQRRDTGPGALTLSPASLATLSTGERVLLPSPNGSKLSHDAATSGATVLCGSLRNARAVAASAERLAQGANIALVPAGERWPDGSLRPAIEDLLGVGHILASLRGPGCDLTAEAALMRDTALATTAKLSTLLHDSQSGLELSERGFVIDVDMAAALNASDTTPILGNGIYRHL